MTNLKPYFTLLQFALIFRPPAVAAPPRHPRDDNLRNTCLEVTSEVNHFGEISNINVLLISVFQLNVFLEVHCRGLSTAWRTLEHAHSFGGNEQKAITAPSESFLM